MIKVEAGCLADAKEAAFAVVGIGPFEEARDNLGNRIKTTVFVLHANELFCDEYLRRQIDYANAFACDSIEEYAAMKNFEREACRLTCSEDALLRRVGERAFVVTWERPA